MSVVSSMSFGHVEIFTRQFDIEKWDGDYYISCLETEIHQCMCDNFLSFCKVLWRVYVRYYICVKKQKYRKMTEE